MFIFPCGVLHSTENLHKRFPPKEARTHARPPLSLCTMLRARTEIVREVVGERFLTMSEIEKRHIELTILQILAPIYAPPRSSTPVEVDVLLDCVKRSKVLIDEKETELKLQRPAPTPIPVSVFPSEPYPVGESRPDFQSPIPHRISPLTFHDKHTGTLFAQLHRPTPQRIASTFGKMAIV